MAFYYSTSTEKEENNKKGPLLVRYTVDAFFYFIIFVPDKTPVK